MARSKKPVDRTPICDPAYLRQIDPVWLSDSLPLRFWEDRAHRRDYLLWLAGKLRFRYMTDWYRLKLTRTGKAKHGQRLSTYWGLSALAAVQDCFPLHDWKPWLFSTVPIGFWDSRANRRSYMNWLGERLGYRCRDDWYRLNTYDFRRNRGKGLMNYYHSAVRAVIDLIPARDWCEWKFEQVPSGFWDVAENRQRYLRWLGKELGFRRAEDWYRIRSCDIARRHGTALLHRYASHYDLMREFLPRLDWNWVDRRRPIRIEEVLAWADAHHARQGKWPTSESGAIPGTVRTWLAIDASLRQGLCGLPGGSSLARLLEKQRGVRWGRRPPDLTENQILAWSDAFLAAKRKWPKADSGPIAGTRETWYCLDAALRVGGRSLAGGSSLAQLLAERRGVRNIRRLPPLSEPQILAWADTYFAAERKWPSRNSGPISGAADTWSTVASALNMGYRGLKGGSSLAQLLAKRRGVRNASALPRLTEQQILAWTDAHFMAHRTWPTGDSGPIGGTGETWSAVAVAMQAGCRGFRRGYSLAKLLAKYRGVRNRKGLPPLKERQIVAWAKAHRRATGRWPSRHSGPVAQSPGNTWMAVDMALSKGFRRLPGGSSLAKLLRKHGLGQPLR